MKRDDGHRTRPVAGELGNDGESFRLLVESVRDYAIFLLDPGGHVATWNEGARRMKGYEEDEILGRHFSIFYPAAEVESGHPAHELERAVEDGAYEEEGWRVRKDGSTFWADVVITSLKDDTGALCGFAKVTRDMTERRRTEEQLREAYADVERRNLSMRHAAQINDDIVQALAVAHYAIARNDQERTEQAVEQALTQAKKFVTDLLPASPGVTPGGLRRS